jgi:hypothetical protein
MGSIATTHNLIHYHAQTSKATIIKPQGKMTTYHTIANVTTSILLILKTTEGDDGEP